MRAPGLGRLFDLLATLLLVGSIIISGAVAWLLIRPVSAHFSPPSPPPIAPTAITITKTPTSQPDHSVPTWPATWTPVPTDTPVPEPTATPLLPSGVTPLPSATAGGSGMEARVSDTAGYLRLRRTPGTTGVVIGSIPAATPLDLIGRTSDNAWLEVNTPDQQHGWAMAQYVDVFIKLQEVPVTSQTAMEASPTPAPPGTTTVPDAQVAAGGQGLRLRQSPGTAGTVITSLEALTPLSLMGRTADNQWLQVLVQTPPNQQGWVMTQFVETTMALDGLPVTGTPIDATATTAPTLRNTSTLIPTRTATATRAPNQTTVASATPGLSETPTVNPPAATATVTLPPPPPPSATAGQPPGGVFDPRPYISGVTQHSRDIFLAGQARGNRADVFSKVGDSITVYWQFLIRIGQSRYNLRDYGYLNDALQHFLPTRARNGNSFVNTSLAAKSGWSSFSVLAPALADTTYCQAHESPLVCEYRLTRPAVALIMIGTNDIYNSYSNEAYEANLRRIVSDSIDMGIIPALSTIPPFQLAGFEGRTDQINAIIWKVAQENDIPVWDFYGALQALPNQGIGSDGVHPSFAPDPADFTADNLQYGFTVRNLLAAQLLDTLWRQAMYP